MKFWKMNGAGNDFIIINNIEEKIDLLVMPKIVKILCERHLSIGADGVLVVEKSKTKDTDFFMYYYNRDGSIGEMCGNGARCICRYGFENNLCKNENKQIIETMAGIVIGERINKQNYKIRLNNPNNIKLDIPIDCNLENVIQGKLLVSYVEIGNNGVPHVVVFIDNLKNYDRQKLFLLGRYLRYRKEFEKGANVNFYDILDRDYIYEITYERGVEDFTYACGTGTGSVVTVLNKKGIVSDKNVKVVMKGGTLLIDINKEKGIIKDLFLTGPTNIVIKGEVFDENL